MASAPTQPRRRLSKQARRATLIAAAEAVFSEAGYSGATMELVAAQAGVTRSLLYEHFASIDEIYLECHRAAREEMEQRLFAAAGQAGARLEDQLRVGLVAYFGYFGEQPQRFELLYGPGGPGGPLAEQTAELRFISAERIAAMFIAAAPQVPKDEAVAAAHIVSGGAEQLARWWRRNPGVSIETLVDWVMIAIWPGMRNRLDDATG
ncbi:MAG TPA: TetR/AcrR family transcriptional regulator [Solirubrobacterales bacterium]|jgi:AcrR family transcriptional regulator